MTKLKRIDWSFGIFDRTNYVRQLWIVPIVILVIILCITIGIEGLAFLGFLILGYLAALFANRFEGRGNP